MIIPEGRETRLHWSRDREFGEFSPIRYLTDGESFCRTDELERILVHFVTSVLDRLIEQGLTGTPLEKEWSALSVLGTDEREYCIVSAKLGLDPFAEADEFESDIMDAAQRLPQEFLWDFFDAVDPRRIPQAVEWVTDATLQARNLAGDPSPEVSVVRGALAGSSEFDVFNVDSPWRLGWRQAQVARRSLGLANDSRVDIDDLVPSGLRSGVDSHVQAVGVAPGTSGRPAVVLGRALHASSRRFIQGRALWHRIA
ncbi:MAG: hypothetical protein LC808_11780, partial [Actinobacteria bacterium]|nr:hypothetical protein [Actinomycetota bacterium]